jgi:hypothetical protein
VTAALRAELETGTDATAELLLRLYALLAMSKGEATTLRDVHDAWSLWMAPIKPEHPSLVPFDQLTEAVQKEDQPFLDAILRVARQSTAFDPI